MNNFCLVYITVPTPEVGEKIARSLLEANLIACANLVKGVSSFYRWEGKMETLEECLLLVKSEMQLFPKLEQKVKELHPYDCPALVVLPIEEGSADFLKWVEKETTQNIR